MKKASSDKKEPAPVPPPRKALEDSDPESHHEHKLHIPRVNLKVGGKCKQYCLLGTYTSLGALTVVVSAATIIVSALASVAIKIYDSEQSNRLMAMVVIAVTATITLSMVCYAVIGAFRKKTSSLHAVVITTAAFLLTMFAGSPDNSDIKSRPCQTGLVLVMVAIIQALIIGVAIHVTPSDEHSISKFLVESFNQSRFDKPRHVKLWAATQSDLKCCGVNGPKDYSDPIMPPYIPLNVPISCCPSYDPERPPHAQEPQREICKANHTFYQHGCRDVVVEVFKETSAVIVGVVVVLIVVEMLLSVTGVVLLKKYKHDQKEHEDHDHKEEPAPSPPSPPTKT